ncbi:MAG: HD domain-containing protein [Candidatus Levybacteria bacterium]|nr:HD domain-containing protein [Candidatus Levybacteria bacterium]
MSLKNTLNYLQFFKEVGKSKRLPRSGWVRERIKDPESVAEHSFRIGALVMVLSDKFGYKLDKEKLLKMALLVALGELATGDVVTGRGEYIDIKKRDEMERQERGGIKEMFDKIGDSEEYSAIYDEMIGRVTPEAKAFWQLDRIEMALQALEYEEEQGKKLEEFFINTSLYLKEPLLKEILGKIMRSRKKEYQKSLREKLEGKI